jgi:hypothetical protein
MSKTDKEVLIEALRYLSERIELDPTHEYQWKSKFLRKNPPKPYRLKQLQAQVSGGAIERNRSPHVIKELAALGKWVREGNYFVEDARDEIARAIENRVRELEGKHEPA